MNLFQMFEEWRANKSAIGARNLRRELDAELIATHHFLYNGIHFKMYLN